MSPFHDSLRRLRPLSLCLPVATLIAALACGGDSGGSTTAPTPVPARIAVTPAQTDTLTLGATYQLSATVYSSDNTVLTGDPVTYASTDSSVATISSTGLVTAGRYGTANISASIGGIVSNTVTIVVFNAALSHVPQTLTLVQPISSSLTIGASTPVQVKVTDLYGSPVAGTSVSFAVQNGNGTVTPMSVLTDASGIASATWTLGTILALGNSLLVTAGTVQTVIVCTPLAGPPVSLSMAYPFTAVSVGYQSSFFLTGVDAYGNVFTPTSPQFVSRNPAVVAVSTGSGSYISQGPGQTYVVGSVGNVADSTLIAVIANNGILLSAPAPRFDLKADTTFSTNVQVTSGSSASPIGSLTATVTWDPSVLTYVSDGIGDGINGSVTVNTTNVANGSLTIALASGTAIGTSFVLRRVTFIASSVVGRHGTLNVTVSDISSNDFVSLLPVTQVISFPVRTR